MVLPVYYYHYSNVCEICINMKYHITIIERFFLSLKFCWSVTRKNHIKKTVNKNNIPGTLNKLNYIE